MKKIVLTQLILKSDLIKSMGFYTIANVLNASIPFLLLPVLTTYLNTDEYGKLSIIQSFLSFMLPFVSINIYGSIGIEYFRMEKYNLSRYISTAVILPFISALSFFVLFFFTGHFIAAKFFLDYYWLLLLPFFTLFQSITMVVLALFQASRKPINYGLFQIGLTILNISLSLLFVIIFQLSFEGRLYGILFSYLIFFFISFGLLFKLGYLTLSFKKVHVQSILKFGIPLIPHTIGANLIAMSDRLLLSKLIDNNAVGIYVVGFQVGQIMMVIQDSFNQAWSPYLFSKLTNINEAEKLKLVKKSYIIMLGILFCVLFFYFLTPFIFKFFISQKYHDAIHYVFWILLGYGFLGMYKTATNYIFFQKKTYILAYVTFACAIFSISMNYIFINKFGAIGAAYTNTITWFLFFVLTWYLSNKIFPMPWLFFLNKKGI